MNLGIGLGITNYQGVPTVPLDPDAVIAALFGSGEEGAWYDPSDLSTVWQDAAGTTPATAGDPVGRIDDKSGNGNHATQSTSTKRPTLQTSGGLYYLDFDGVDDFMGPVTFPSPITQPITDGFAFKLDAAHNNDYIIDGISSGERMYIYSQSSQLRFVVGSNQNYVYYNQLTDPYVFVSHRNAALSDVKVNGVSSGVVNLGTNQVAGIYLGNAYDGLTFSVPDGKIYGAVIVSKTLTAAQITELETYLATKSGVTLP